MARQTGADVDKERHVPELHNLFNTEVVATWRAAPKYEESVLDIVVRASTAADAWWWDVTIRSPHAVRNVHAHEVAAEAMGTVV